MFLQPKLGLTLSGGGARGGGHIGVLRVLDEIGYLPEVIVGTSIGGLVAALVGSGKTIEEMEASSVNADFANVLHLDRTGGGLLGTDRLAAVLQNMFGNTDLRDLSPHIAVVAADLRSNRRILVDKGPVVKAILATMAIPGLFPPVEWDGYLLVDGGVVDNVPTQATYQLGARRIVAVDVGTINIDLGLTLAETGTFGRQLQRTLYWLLGLSKGQTTFDTWSQAHMFTLKFMLT